ncbi:MAG: peptide chain release factor-like protein [Planctomycetota bacterium]|nr:MAG: peptide chain release factor-like protein [Planctomycetota bacterium]
MPADVHPAALPREALLAQVEELRSRGTGPGGQRRNKVQTQVRLVHVPTGVSALAGERRSLVINRGAALYRLRLALALGHRTQPASGPSELWRRRTGGATLAVGSSHDDVPALLAEALDVLDSVDDELPAAASRLQVSTSRLVRVLKLEPAALAALNQRLRAAGRSTWR